MGKTDLRVQGTDVRKRLLAVFITFMLAFVLVPTVGNAETTEQNAVNAAKSGVLNIVLYYVADDGTNYALQTGSGFLINNEYLITCYHVVNLSPEVADAAAGFFGDDFRDHLSVKAIVMRDMEIELTIENQSEATDFSILKLKQIINDRNVLKLGKSEEVEQTESVYALGFPSVVTEIGATTSTSFTTSDVTVESGTISKILTGVDGVDYIQHSAKVSSGNSGGPLVDENGAVVGVNKAVVATDEFFSSGYYYALSMDQVTQALDALGVPYEAYDPSSDPRPSGEGTDGEPADPADVDKSLLATLLADFTPLTSDLGKYTEESANRFTAALNAAKGVNDNSEATQQEVDSSVSSLTEAQRGLVERPAPPIALILGIGAAVVVVIAAILLLVVNSKKKKKAPAPAPATLPTGSFPPPTAPVAQQPVFTSATVPDSGLTTSSIYPPPPPPPSSFAPPAPSGLIGYDATGSGETTVLNPTVGETSLLGGAQTPASLRRVSNNEKIRIDRSDFVIGKERSRVNYVIPDNGTISRQHAKITQRGGQFFVTDLKATNFTFVNDKKIAPGAEVPLASGDRIKLSDEEFIFEL
jgi:S1-C subfamily serine protease